MVDRDTGSERLASLKRLALVHTTVDGHAQSSCASLHLYRCSQPSRYRKASSFGVTLGIVLQGHKRVRLAGREFDVDPTRFLVVTSETEHESAVIAASPERPFLGLGLCFSADRVARALLELSDAGVSGTYEDVPAFLLPHDDAIAGAVERVLMAFGDPVERRLLLPLYADEILFRLLRSDAAAVVRNSVSRPDAGRILNAMQFIRANVSRTLSVDRIARHVAMSPSHFAHRFRAVARVSPMRYQRDLRLEQARTLLIGNGVRAGEVASRVGFESQSHFTREFKRRYGVPPSHYLRQFADRSAGPIQSVGDPRSVNYE
jgi:AraC-like DNA-binding protein